MRLLVVGTGLIGTSVALAASAGGYDVSLEDQDPERVALAVSVGAGSPRRAGDPPVDLAVAAVPPAAVGGVVSRLIEADVAPILTHLASVQSDPQHQVESLHPGFAGFVGSHPIAGRERSGPHHASADLFSRRPWIVCPTEASAPAAVAAVSALAAACGALVTVMPATDHDALFARLSHSPQLVASALAGGLAGLDRAAVGLAGTGLRDTTRIADSDANLWAEIVAANPGPVATALRAVLEPLHVVVDALEHGADDRRREAVRDLIERGRRGRELLGGKHGQRAVRWATVAVVVPDEPGKLARVLNDAAAAGVNVEDIRVDHSPGQPFGIVELDVAPDRGALLERDLIARGWSATASPPPSA
ncbi:MAG: prephenate dehydrogenase [Frankiaceae bacterium]|nr:prephenate dehydrogenase [Frankiaceae bacterium]MBV9869223.1 prephenate dehydrogenase [Frankiaceae bacterium]